MWWLFGRKNGSGFSSSSTAEEVTQGIDGSNLTAIVTGATSGIGVETARVLAMRGVHVIMGVRNLVTAKDVKEVILKEIPTAKLDYMELDLSSMASVRKFASNFISSGLPLNILINNAGIFGTPFTLSEDNIELQFATNHIGPFLLTNLCLDIMKKTAHESKKQGRVVNVSSIAHHEEGVDITANSLHPGVVLTNIFRHTILSGLINTVGRLVFKNVQQVVRVAVSRKHAGPSSGHGGSIEEGDKKLSFSFD
ncbi:hypothetical protein V8G54_011107 [Vigna mungo]|uniref:Uncharacterized protein n=1 Tax=Vigna mungo TaxID=3915 RepID=A0AAQ3NP07_VIGMU